MAASVRAVKSLARGAGAVEDGLRGGLAVHGHEAAWRRGQRFLAAEVIRYCGIVLKYCNA